jgi:hypothetical protein
MTKLWPLFSISSTSSSGNPSSTDSASFKVPEQSRIWWYTTSVFGSLPLHAMGPIPSDDGETRYFLDLYICSYTPTLSALIQSRHHDSGSRSSDRPSILLVAQPDPSLPTVGGEIQVLQALDTEVSSLISEDCNTRRSHRWSPSPPICSLCVSRNPGSWQTIRSRIRAIWRCTPDATRYRARPSPCCRIRIPLCLSHS